MMRKDVRNYYNVKLDTAYADGVTFCSRGSDTLHANRIPHHQMMVLIHSGVLLSLVIVAMALIFSFFTFTVVLHLGFFLALPSPFVLLTCTFSVCFHYTACEVLAQEICSVERKLRLCVS